MNGNNQSTEAETEKTKRKEEKKKKKKKKEKKTFSVTVTSKAMSWCLCPQTKENTIKLNLGLIFTVLTNMSEGYDDILVTMLGSATSATQL